MNATQQHNRRGPLYSQASGNSPGWRVLTQIARNGDSALEYQSGLEMGRPWPSVFSRIVLQVIILLTSHRQSSSWHHIIWWFASEIRMCQ